MISNKLVNVSNILIGIKFLVHFQLLVKIKTFKIKKQIKTRYNIIFYKIFAKWYS